jgi:Outer membrane protein beta-barrel domain
MKKLFLTTTLLFIVFASWSQKTKSVSSSSNYSYSGSSMGYKKGDIFASGQFGFSSKGQGDAKESTFGFVPSVGYFIGEKMAVGIAIGFKSSTSKPAQGDSTTNSAFLAGLFGRYYWTPKSQFSLFGQAGLEFASQSSGGNSGSVTTFGLGIKPGVSYFLSNHFNIDATFGQIGFSNTSGSGGGSSNTNFDFGFDLTQINFGLSYKF